jgi:SAM-dependent methyltransferase
MTPSAPLIFDRRLYRLRRARAAATFSAHDFLHRRAMEDVVDRLETVTRDFQRALFFGVGPLVSMLTPRCGVGEAFTADLAHERLGAHTPGVAFDEERSPLADESVDLIVSLLTLHAANDPVGALAQMRRALKPDGLMIAVVFGEDTLAGFRSALYAAEAAASDRVSARVIPFASVRDWGAALQRAGFALPVVDLDRAMVRYETPYRFFHDLRGIGETSMLADRRQTLPKAAAAMLMARLDKAPSVEFDLVTLTGWAPHESQQKPLARGSATASLASAINFGADG